MEGSTCESSPTYTDGGFLAGLVFGRSASSHKCFNSGAPRASMTAARLPAASSCRENDAKHLCNQYTAPAC